MSLRRSPEEESGEHKEERGLPSGRDMYFEKRIDFIFARSKLIAGFHEKFMEG